jgi:TatD DNase family protein
LAVELAKKHDNLFACIGLHPADNASEVFDYEKYSELGSNKRVVAIGECGLDYYRLPKDEVEIIKIKTKQKESFKQHIKLAEELNKPLMIHARPTLNTMNAYNDVLDILESSTSGLKVNFHFFVGDISVARRIIKNNWTMSYDGPITFSSDYDEVIKEIPIELIMAETDSPFASPVPYRGKRCEPWMVTEVVKKIAEIKGLSEAETSEKLLENVKRVFGI